MAAQNDVSDTPASRTTRPEPQPPQRIQDAATVAGAHDEINPQPDGNDEPDQSFLSVLLRALSVWST